jgi:hypothetical protein
MLVTGGTYNLNTGVVTFTNNSGGTFNVSGFTTGYTDVFLTGASYNSSTGILTLTNTDGSTVTATGINDYYVTGGSLNYSTGNLTLNRQNGSVVLTGLKDIYLTGASYNSGTGILSLTNTDGSTVAASGFTSGGGGAGLILAGSCFRSACLTNSLNVSCLVSSITLGECNTISTIGGGISSDCGNSILGGKKNAILASNCSIIAGGSLNTVGISGSNSSILGGTNNMLQGISTAIINGAGNFVGGNFNFAGNGQANCLIGGNYSSIINGVSNKLGSNYSYIGGGYQNTIGDTFIIGNQPYKTIGNGSANIIGPVAGYATIMNGSGNEITSGPGNTILSGNQNLIFNAKYSTILGGNCNSIVVSLNDCTGFIGGGTCNKIYGDQSFIAGGRQNTVRGFDNCVFITGSNITSDRSCTTFVNNLSIKSIPPNPTGLPAGSVYKDANGFLKIV